MKSYVYVKKNVLMGVFSTKKKVWEFLESVEKFPKTLYYKINKKEAEQLEYSAFMKAIKERTMLRIYKKRELDKEFKKCKSYINIWEVETNTHYKLNRRRLK